MHVVWQEPRSDSSWRDVQFSGVHEIPHATLRAFADALAAGHAAALPAAALEPGTTPLGKGGYATVYSATLSNSCIAGAEGLLPLLCVYVRNQCTALVFMSCWYTSCVVHGA